MDTRPSHPWQVVYPPLQAHGRGWLDVGDGHAIYWEECGHPLGRPALVVHGGPGAGCSEDDRRWFDPRRWRIVLFDQRGAGRSRPLGGLAANDTAHLLDDIEALRRHLRIDRWLLFGGSWGSTLALAYAQRQPQRLQALILRGVFTASERERQWLYSPSGAAKTRPAAWQRFVAASSTVPGTESVLDAYAAQLRYGDDDTAHAAARAWAGWEQALMDAEPGSDHRHAASMLAMARIGVHYARHDFHLDGVDLLAGAASLHAVPGVIIQGLDDLVTPPAAALALHHAWPGSQLECIEGAGHASSEPRIAQALVAATDHFA